MASMCTWRPKRRPTLLLRCILIIAAELAVNALLWIVAAIVFRRRTRLLTLCVLAWTLGLRHALDADHISVIDNATRRIVSVHRTSDPATARASRPRRPVTCGLWFSLGHSTIVVAVICAIAISLGIVDRLGKLSSVGGIVGAAVSGSTLFLLAVINSILLYQSIMAARTSSQQSSESAPTGQDDKQAAAHDAPIRDHRFRGIFTRIAYPLFRLVDRPYKMYPIGVLFGLGFDTASSIALLGIAGATNTQVQDTDLGSGETILPQDSPTRSDASIVVLALLFTAGMTLVDSLDSVLMINAYAPGELLRAAPSTDQAQAGIKAKWRSWISRLQLVEPCNPRSPPVSDVAQDGNKQTRDEKTDMDEEEPSSVEERRSTSTSTTLSHLLTLLSILLAFAISIITLLGLIGENCGRCSRAAEKQAQTHDAGLQGRWWLFWQQANDASGIIGACIVASFGLILLVWYAGKAVLRRYPRSSAA